MTIETKIWNYFLNNFFVLFRQFLLIWHESRILSFGSIIEWLQFEMEYKIPIRVESLQLNL